MHFSMTKLNWIFAPDVEGFGLMTRNWKSLRQLKNPIREEQEEAQDRKNRAVS